MKNTFKTAFPSSTKKLTNSPLRFTGIQTCPLLLLLFLFAFCNRQVKKDLPAHSLIESKTIPAEQMKIVKTQGSGQADNIHCGLQDKAGNMWFGTTGEGVYRYDGKSFSNFTEKDGLSSNNVWSVLEDKTGNLWFGTRNVGLCRYDGKSFTDFSGELKWNHSNLKPHILVDRVARTQSNKW